VIQFLGPGAAAGLVLLAGPLLIHMLLRRNARHVMFPATRFLVTTPAAAVRIRRPSDVALLIVRLAIVAAAIAAVARPLVITERRLAQWDSRVARAVILDTSGALQQNAEAARLAEQEMSAFHAQRFPSADLRDAVARAADWLAGAPPARREVVIVSDFQRGALDGEDLAVLPAGTGLRAIRASGQAAARDARWPVIAGFRGGTWQPRVRLDARSTNVTWSRTANPPSASWLTTMQAPGENQAARRAVDAAVSAGRAAGDENHRVEVRFAGAPAASAERRPVRTRWMVDAALALRQSALLRQTRAGVDVAEQDGRLIVDTTAAATSIEAPAVVRAIVLAVRPASIGDREAEVAALPDAELAAWRREPAPIGSVMPRLNPGRGSESDARWFWALALALLGCETWLRRRHDRAGLQQVRDAA
jgi:Aerotolerance regulator N-terminal